MWSQPAPLCVTLYCALFSSPITNHIVRAPQSHIFPLIQLRATMSPVLHRSHHIPPPDTIGVRCTLLVNPPGNLYLSPSSLPAPPARQSGNIACDLKCAPHYLPRTSRPPLRFPSIFGFLYYAFVVPLTSSSAYSTSSTSPWQRLLLLNLPVRRPITRLGACSSPSILTCVRSHFSSLPLCC